MLDLDITIALQPATSVLQAKTQDGIVLLETTHGRTFPLDLVGTNIWQLITQRFTTSEIADAIANEFGIPREQALADTVQFIESMYQEHLLVPTEPDGQARKPRRLSELRTWVSRFFGVTRKQAVSKHSVVGGN